MLPRAGRRPRCGCAPGARRERGRRSVGGRPTGARASRRRRRARPVTQRDPAPARRPRTRPSPALPTHVLVPDLGFPRGPLARRLRDVWGGHALRIRHPPAVGDKRTERATQVPAP
eukprot:scaffold1190_cov393-Prasinococcus_capsulatus_cf.AAC.3